MKRFLFTAILILNMLLAACNLNAGGPGPRTWIDSPLDGSTLPLEPVIVISHAASDIGTAQMALLVNGERVRVDHAADTTNRLISISQVWNPDAPGRYTLQVISTDHSGNEGSSNPVTVQIGGIVETRTQGPESVTGTPSVTETPGPTTTATQTQITVPVFTFNTNAFCRTGPGTNYPDETVFEAGRTVEIVGRSDFNPPWWLVVIPGSGERCWASDSTGTASGPTAGVQVVQAPPPPPTLTPTVVVILPPVAPGNFSVTNKTCNASDYIVTLAWGDVNNEDGYRIYRDGNLIATLGPNASSFDDDPPDYNPHTYRVESFNSSGSSSSGSSNSTGCVF